MVLKALGENGVDARGDAVIAGVGALEELALEGSEVAGRECRAVPGAPPALPDRGDRRCQRRRRLGKAKPAGTESGPHAQASVGQLPTLTLPLWRAATASSSSRTRGTIIGPIVR